MATLSKKQLKGSVGDITYTAFNGNVYLRSKPGKGNVRQTTATKSSASDFGRASTLAKAIRGALFPILQDHSDSFFYRRFTAMVSAATQSNNPQPKGSRSLIEGDLSLLANIDANTNSPFANYCNLTPLITLSATRTITIAPPAFVLRDHISKPETASHAELVFLVTAIDPQSNAESHAEMFRLALSLHATDTAAQQFTTAALPDNHLIVVASAMFYYRDNNLAGMISLNGKALHPCAISAVLRS